MGSGSYWGLNKCYYQNHPFYKNKPFHMLHLRNLDVSYDRWCLTVAVVWANTESFSVKIC